MAKSRAPGSGRIERILRARPSLRPGAVAADGDRRALLCETLARELDPAVESGRLEAWAVAPVSFPSRSRPSFGYDVVALFPEGAAPDPAFGDEKLTRDVLERLRGKWGDRELRSFFFAVLDRSTLAFRDCLDALSGESLGGRAIDLALASLFLMIEAHGLEPGEVESGAVAFATHLHDVGNSGDSLDSFLSERRLLAEAVLAEKSLAARIASYARGDRLEWAAALEPHLPGFRELGATLSDLSPQLPGGISRELATWNHVFHQHLLMLGIDNRVEAALHFAAARALGSPLERGRTA